MAPLARWVFGSRPATTPSERRFALRVVAVTVIPLALICVLALIIGGTVEFARTNDAIKDARAATARTRALTLVLNAQRAFQTRSNAWAIYDACVENENQDQVTADLLRKFRRQIKSVPPPPDDPRARKALADSLDAIQVWLDAREPPGESDCQIPPFPRPER